MSLDLSPPPPPSPRLRAAHWVYQALLHLLMPAILGMALLRSRREPLYRAHLSHRFGFGPAAPEGAVWIFASSLGETRAVSPLVEALVADGRAVCLTHITPAGLVEGQRLFDSPLVVHRYAPFDWFWAVALFLSRQRPAVGLIVESELWAGFLMVARAFGVPMMHVNGNLLDRTIERDGRRFGGVRLELFRQFTAVLTKTAPYRDRYLRAGVPAARIALPGELKFDQRRNAGQLCRGAALRRDWAGDRPVLLLASSVAGEEEALAGLVARLAPLARVVWVPRSPQRFDAVADRLERDGHRVARRSTVLSDRFEGTVGDAVLVGDTLGEMDFYYALADLVFVGASLVDHGGHNIVEPLSLGKPVVMGPSIYGITFPAVEAEASGALRLAPDAEALTAEVERLMADRDALGAFTARAADFASAHTGAAQRSVELLRPVLR